MFFCEMHARASMIACAVGFVGSFLPLVTKGSYGITPPMLTPFIYLSYANAVPLLLYLLPVVGMAVFLVGSFGKMARDEAWFLVLGAAGLWTTAVGVAKGFDHFELFSHGCGLFPELRNHDGPATVGTGGILQAASYMVLVLAGMLAKFKRKDATC